MNKLIIFDLDGVLIDSRDIHYEALNRALLVADDGDKYAISYDEHLSSYDGLSTTVKLNKLTREKGLPVDIHKKVWEEKQRITFDIFRNLNRRFSCHGSVL
jgi:beta-phosphoglucomutase-like phosphatase (HAD superfamily)